MTAGVAATHTIVIIEDDKAVAELVRTVLADEPSWQALVVHDAHEARELLRFVRPDALVLDVNLPGMSGIDLLSFLRRQPSWHNPAVVIMSANVSQAQAVAALGDSAGKYYLAKPFDIDELVALVGEAMAEAAPGAPAVPDRTAFSPASHAPWSSPPPAVHAGTRSA